MAAHERETEGRQDQDLPTNSAGAEDTSKELRSGSTRLGPWGEIGLALVLGLVVLYMLALSNSKSRFSRPVRLQGQGWPQPRGEARNWAQQHALYAAQAAEDKAELLFYGDTAFELWRGTVHMDADPRGHNVPEIFHDYFGAVYKSAVFAIAGDATPQLMWRIQNGEAPEGLRTAKAVVVLMGTADLTHASFQGDPHIPLAANTTAGRIAAIVNHLHTAARDARIIILGLLPRGDQTLMPDPGMFAQPSKFSQTISEVNAMLHGFAEAHPSCTFLDCGNGFLTADRHALDLELMPDALHPSAAGMEVLAKCLKPAVAEAIGH